MRPFWQSAVFAPEGDAASAAPAPVADAPAPAASEAAPAPAPVAEAAPAPSPAPATEAAPAPAEAAPAAPSIVPSLLDGSATPPAPAETTGETPAADAAPASTETPPEGPVSYELAFPDDVDPKSVNEERFNAARSLLAETMPHEKGQELMNLYFEDLKDVTRRTYDQMVDQFNELQMQRQEAVKSDPVLGGARFNTAMAECNAVIQRFGGDEAERAELMAELRNTGAGNSPLFLRMLNRVYDANMREGAPVPTPPSRAPVLSREQRGLARYNGSAAR